MSTISRIKDPAPVQPPEEELTDHKLSPDSDVCCAFCGLKAEFWPQQPKCPDKVKRTDWHQVRY